MRSVPGVRVGATLVVLIGSIKAQCNGLTDDGAVSVFGRDADLDAWGGAFVGDDEDGVAGAYGFTRFGEAFDDETVACRDDRRGVLVPAEARDLSGGDGASGLRVFASRTWEDLVLFEVGRAGKIAGGFGETGAGLGETGVELARVEARERLACSHAVAFIDEEVCDDAAGLERDAEVACVGDATFEGELGVDGRESDRGQRDGDGVTGWRGGGGVGVDLGARWRACGQEEGEGEGGNGECAERRRFIGHDSTPEQRSVEGPKKGASWAPSDCWIKGLRVWGGRLGVGLAFEHAHEELVRVLNDVGELLGWIHDAAVADAERRHPVDERPAGEGGDLGVEVDSVFGEDLGHHVAQDAARRRWFRPCRAR